LSDEKTRFGIASAICYGGCIGCISREGLAYTGSIKIRFRQRLLNCALPKTTGVDGGKIVVGGYEGGPTSGRVKLTLKLLRKVSNDMIEGEMVYY